MTDEVKEEVKLETELLRYLVLIAIALGSGSLSVVLGGLAGIRLPLAVAGVLGTISLGPLAWFQYKRILAIVRKGGDA